MAEENKPLKPEHRIFAEQYVIDWNGSRSYKVAYPDVTDETARVNASKLLTNTNIKEYIEEIQKDLAKLAGVSALSNKNHLKEIIEKEEEGVKKEATRDRINALKVINEMLGLNAPEQKQIEIKQEPPLFPDVSHE